jgi:hypothetical protein
VFEAPFRPFVHRWADLLEYRKREDIDATTTEHLNLLYDVLQEELKDVIKTFEDYIQYGVVTYEHLWTIFQPGDIIYSDSHFGAPSAMVFRRGAYVKTQCGMAYSLRAEVLDWDGRNFGRRALQILIFEYMGTTRITGLKAYPFSFHRDMEQVRESLIQRGKKFEQLAGSHYRE